MRMTEKFFCIALTGIFIKANIAFKTETQIYFK